LVTNVAWPEPFRVPVPRVLEPSLKVTVPVGVPAPGLFAVTVAVKVTDCPDTDGLIEELTRVVVLGSVAVGVDVLEGLLVVVGAAVVVVGAAVVVVGAAVVVVGAPVVVVGAAVVVVGAAVVVVGAAVVVVGGSVVDVLVVEEVVVGSVVVDVVDVVVVGASV